MLVVWCLLEELAPHESNNILPCLIPIEDISHKPLLIPRDLSGQIMTLSISTSCRFPVKQNHAGVVHRRASLTSPQINVELLEQYRHLVTHCEGHTLRKAGVVVVLEERSMTNTLDIIPPCDSPNER